MPLYKRTGVLQFGTRLKRLSDKFLTDLSTIYNGQDIQFEASWFPVFYLLSSQKEVTISRIARELEITHPGASQLVTSLKKKKFVQIVQNREDKRVKKVVFTKSGKEKLQEIQPVWKALLETMNDLPGIEGKPSNALELLEELEKEMSRIDLVGLVEKKLRFNRFLKKIQIIPYTEAYHDALMALALNWMAENPGTLPANIDWINRIHETGDDPKTHMILLAVHLEQIIAACVAVMDTDTRTARVIFVLEDGRISDETIQALLDKTGGELAEKDILEITADVETGNSDLLKVFQKNNFKLKEIENASGARFARLCRNTR